MTAKYISEVLTSWNSSDQKIFKLSDLKYLHDELLNQKKVPHIGIRAFIKALLEETDLKSASLSFPNRTENRYYLPDYSIYDLAASVRIGSYFSHGTAAILHGFSKKSSRNIYLNYEQSPKPLPKEGLTQESIDRAFNNHVRVSNNKADFEKFSIFIVNGKYTNKLGVINVTGPSGEILQVTDIERTLIDVAVRPVYAGGVEKVLQIYKQAANSLSIEKLLKTLISLKYVYPYHQAIGFYLDRTKKFSSTELEVFKKLSIEYKFYLTHHIKSKNFSSDWQIYYPIELDK